MNNIGKVIVLCLIYIGSIRSWIGQPLPSARAERKFEERQEAKRQKEALAEYEDKLRKNKRAIEKITTDAEKNRRLVAMLAACAGSAVLSSFASNSNKVIRYGTRTLTVAACSAAGIQWVVMDDGKN